ncbi:hypothetical protein [Jidongwangia harbinensis]|uniref:hypothetical protein n=1 Tax=Jidongwangia harbinensis TaxID=2878561 RepID=UPI001CD9E1F7|nr:hypothetical protein [Jidongwangia harbinensis]MCA2216693.1 hypothetical protein [Jidongwangia harbinensis]
MSTDVEDRLRRALRARAGQITADRLQPAVPPTATAVPRSWRRWWVPLVVAAALAAVFFAVRPDGTLPRPVPNPPAVPVPSEPPAPVEPSPAPPKITATMPRATTASSAPTPSQTTLRPRRPPATVDGGPEPAPGTTSTGRPDGAAPAPTPGR